MLKRDWERVLKRSSVLDTPPLLFYVGNLFHELGESECITPVTNSIEQLTGRSARTFYEWTKEHAVDFRNVKKEQTAKNEGTR